MILLSDKYKFEVSVLEDVVDALIKELFQKQELYGEVSEIEIIDAVIERGLPLFYVTVVSEGLRQKATANSLLESSSVMSIAHDKDDTQTVVNDSCSKYSQKERIQKYDSAYLELSTHEPLFVKESFFSDYQRASIQSTYIPVFLLAFFDVSKLSGNAPLNDVIDYYRNFYNSRKNMGLIVERSDSIFVKSFVDDKDIRKLILFNPLGRSFLRKYFKYEKKDNSFRLNPKLLISLTDTDLYEIKSISNQILDSYYMRLNK